MLCMDSSARRPGRTCGVLERSVYHTGLVREIENPRPNLDPRKFEFQIVTPAF